MAYYFKTSNANRSYRVGGKVIWFEPTLALAGTKLGVFSTDSKEIALGLGNYSPTVTNITEEEYEAEKKRDPSNGSNWEAPPKSLTRPQPESAADSGDLTDGEPKAVEDVEKAIIEGEVEITDELTEAVSKRSTPKKTLPKGKNRRLRAKAEKDIGFGD
jgi:hypothetical protein